LRLFGGRRYPIKRDANGHSVRQRAFDLFRTGQRPAQVSKTIPISLRTACRYFQDYKRIHHQIPYTTIRKWVRENPEISNNVIAILATSLDMTPEEVVVRMQKPWGLLQAMKGKWPDYRLDRQRSEIEGRLLAALEIIKFAEIFSQRDPQFVRVTLEQIMMNRREESPET
jgi:plasmid maintenance system antidote protein VapI